MSPEENSEVGPDNLHERKREAAINVMALLRQALPKTGLGRVVVLGFGQKSDVEIPKFEWLSTPTHRLDEITVAGEPYVLRRKFFFAQWPPRPVVEVDLVGGLEDPNPLQKNSRGVFIAALHIADRRNPEDMEAYVNKDLIEGKSEFSQLVRLEDPVDPFWDEIKSNLIEASQLPSLAKESHFMR